MNIAEKMPANNMRWVQPWMSVQLLGMKFLIEGGKQQHISSGQQEALISLARSDVAVAQVSRMPTHVSRIPDPNSESDRLSMGWLDTPSSISKVAFGNVLEDTDFDRS